MPQSPFPGMDPYLENPALWPEFHRGLIDAIRLVLAPGLVDRYRQRVGKREYAEVARPEEFIEIRDKNDDHLVTLIDVVSPANKTTAQGREAYLEQRRQAKNEQASIVEIDLVLQGAPTLDYSREGLPDWNYAVTVTRRSHPDRYEIYTSTLEKRLPRFRLPLAGDDRDTVIDLQVAFSRCYSEGNFFERIDYCRDPEVPLADKDLAWLDAHLVAQQLRNPLPRHDAIALVAYGIWEQAGRPHGCDGEHWVKAVERLRRRN